MKKMNWIHFIIFSSISSITMISCSEENYNSSDFVAGETFTDSNIRLIRIDTLTVSTSTMKFDSITTSESTRILAGKYNDTVFGTVKASSFMQMLPTTYTIDSDAQFDSIILVLGLDHYYYNDTLLTNTLHIKKVNTELKPKGEDDYFYNTSTASYDEEDLGSLEYKPRPLSGDSITIPLIDDFGGDIFSKLQNKKIVNGSEFTDYFKGLGLIPGDTDDGSIIGFSKASEKTYIRLYFSVAESDGNIDDYLDIQINSSNSPIPFFNSIVAENPKEYLQTLTDREINLASSESGGQSFIQSGIGIAMRIQFPTIENLYDIPGEGTIISGVLKIKPTPQSYDDNLKLKDTLAVYIVDNNNNLLEQLSIAESSTVNAILKRDNQEYSDIYYEISLAYYLEELQLRSRDVEGALILIPSDYNSAVDRFILNSNGRAENETILELTYAIYDED
ncbi:DUF4270 family protein [Maribacter sp. X9]|uniref:DUF4270 family protein n=1 Tax=Maribacter sp. X9 TaxID=3402159 RepID=UPI003AF3AA0D